VVVVVEFNHLPLQSGFAATPLRFDHSFIYQHNGDVVFDRIDAMTLHALQAFGILAVFERLLVGGANQHFQQFLGDHQDIILRHRRWLDFSISNFQLTIQGGQVNRKSAIEIRQSEFDDRGCSFP
jgi:hypothetical protein